jgi:hypothetical protein
MMDSSIDSDVEPEEYPSAGTFREPPLAVKAVQNPMENGPGSCVANLE